MLNLNVNFFCAIAYPRKRKYNNTIINLTNWLICKKVLIIHISYENEKLMSLFHDFRQMQAKIGIEKARTIKKHMDVLRASTNFQCFLSLRLGKPHSLDGNLKGCYGIHVTGNTRLIVRPLTNDTGIEAIGKCEQVSVKGVCDYHGGKHEWIIK